MYSKIIIEWDSKVTKVKFNNHKFFGKLEFEGIGDLNVIKGPNGVGKSRLLKEMNEELKKRSIYSPEVNLMLRLR